MDVDVTSVYRLGYRAIEIGCLKDEQRAGEEESVLLLEQPFHNSVASVTQLKSWSWRLIHSYSRGEEFFNLFSTASLIDWEKRVGRRSVAVDCVALTGDSMYSGEGLNAQTSARNLYDLVDFNGNKNHWDFSSIEYFKCGFDGLNRSNAVERHIVRGWTMGESTSSSMGYYSTNVIYMPMATEYMSCGKGRRVNETTVK